MSYTSYTNCLSSSSWDDTLGNIRVRWASDAPNRLQEFASNEQVPTSTVKALSEHLAYATAYRIGSTQVVIQGSPHINSINSATGQVSQDGLHITVNATGGGAGQNKVHIYLDGVGSGFGAYDNVWAKAETVHKRSKKGYSIDTNMSYGGGELASGSVATSSGGYQGGTSSGTATSGGGPWGAAYGTAGVSGGAASSSSASYSEWDWDETYQRHKRYNYSTQQWEWNQ